MEKKMERSEEMKTKRWRDQKRWRRRWRWRHEDEDKGAKKKRLIKKQKHKFFSLFLKKLEL